MFYIFNLRGLGGVQIPGLSALILSCIWYVYHRHLVHLQLPVREKFCVINTEMCENFQKKKSNHFFSIHTSTRILYSLNAMHSIFNRLQNILFLSRWDCIYDAPIKSLLFHDVFFVWHRFFWKVEDVASLVLLSWLIL